MQELSPYLIDRTVPEVINLSPSAMVFAQDQPNFREYWRVIAKRWRFIVTLVTCTLALTSLVVFFITPTYTAMSSILIEPQAPQVLDMTELETQELGDENYYGTQYKILQSRSLAARVIRELNLQNELFLPAGTTEALAAGSLAQKDSKDPIVHDENPAAGTLGIRWCH
jgi:uncharacterized protein involved in exopolysaccharide biosynthesis